MAALLGGILLLLADVAARYIIMPQEVPVGVMTAMIGAPFFIYLARKGGKNNEKHTNSPFISEKISFLLDVQAMKKLLVISFLTLAVFLS